MNDIQLCQTKYLAAEDIAGRNVTVTIAQIEELPKEERAISKNKASKDVILFFEGKQKGMRCNVTNQWAIALLLGSKRSADWEKKRIVLTTDTDADIENGGMTLCLRVVASPDATPPRAKAMADAWEGKRERGALVKRLKSKFRLMSGQSFDPTTTTQPQA